MNHINIAKTLAEANQAYICTNIDSLSDCLEPSKKKHSVTKDVDYKRYRGFLESINMNEIDVDNSIVYHFLKFNGRLYRKGLLVLHEKSFYEIIYVLHSKDDYHLICQKYECVRYVEWLNSIEISKTDNDISNQKCINFNQLSISDSFEKKVFNDSIFIIVECLEMLNVNYNS